MKNIERFLAETNSACDDGEFWITQSLANLNGEDGRQSMTLEELEELDRALDGLSFEQVADDYEETRALPPVVQAAFEWLIGPFEVTHPSYNPYWFREKSDA